MSDELVPIRSTGIGSWPGTRMAEALKITFAECPDLPYLPELPARGVGAGLIGRGVAVLADLSVDLQPAGWRLTGAPGRDQLRARATLRDDLDHLEEAVQDYAGPFKLAVSGPWTVISSVERPRGDRVLADHGARREIVQSLAEGVGTLLADLRRRLPRLDLIIQLDEPLLPAVLAGEVPTASGFSHHRKVDVPEVSDALTAIVDMAERAISPQPADGRGTDDRPATQPPAELDGLVAAGPSRPEPATGPVEASRHGLPRTWLHCCAAGVPVTMIKNAGLGGLALDLDQLDTGDWDRIGQAMTDGLWLGAGALPTSTGASSGRQWAPDPIAQRVLTAVRTLGLEPEIAGRMIITPACGLARFDQRSAIVALRTIRTAAGIVTDQLAD